MALNPVLMYELDLRVGEIAEELRNADLFVSHELVAQILADRYNVLSLTQLGISSPKSLPLLGLIFSLNCVTYNYCATYLATHEISSIIDIEDGLIQHLRSLHLPSILSTISRPKSTKQLDPNELSLSEEETDHSNNIETTCKVDCFLDFGLGRVIKSPALINVLGGTQDGNEKSESIVLHNLSRYIMLQEVVSSEPFRRDSFVSWLCQEWKLRTLNEVGVFIQSNIDNIVAAIKSTLRSRASLLHAHKRRLHQQLSIWEHEENERVQNNQRKRRKKQLSTSTANYESSFLEVLNAVEDEQRNGKAGNDASAHDIICNLIDTTISRRIAESNDMEINRENLAFTMAFEGIEHYIKTRNNQEQVELSLSTTGSKSYLLPTVDNRRNFGNAATNKQEGSQHDAWKEYIVEISNELLQPILVTHISAPSILSNQDVGQLGEGIVYRYLQRSLPSEQFSVQWLNQEKESKAAYDFIVEDLTAERSTFHHKTFVEVKSSRYEDNNVFSISLWEWQFITQLPRVEYHIYRVYGAGDPQKTRITIIKDAHKLLESGRIHLCLSI